MTQKRKGESDDSPSLCHHSEAMSLSAHSLLFNFYNFLPVLKPYQKFLRSIEEDIRFYKAGK